MTETNPPAAFDPDHLPTVAEFDDMVDHNRAHGRVFSFAPAVIRELLGELERLREELSQADTFGRGEFRVTTWAYEQAVRALGCAHQRIRELEAVVPDTGQAPESPTDSTPEAGRWGSGEAETATGGRAPDVAATALRDAARLLDMVADARDDYLDGMKEDSESAAAIENFGSGIRSAARILRAAPHEVELLVPTWRYLGELAELDAQVRALLGTDTTPEAPDA